MILKQIPGRIGWGLMTFLALAISLVSSRYLTLDPTVYFPEQVDVYLRYTVPLMIHVGGSILALAIGPFQFLRSLRTKRPAVHRWLGRLYLLGILLGGVGGFFMAFHAWTGWVARLGFLALAVVWLLTGWLAYRSIRLGKVAEHRRWMIRNYALTFAAVMLRLLNPLLIFGVGMDEALSYQLVAWLCWLPNLLVVELWMRSSGNFASNSMVLARP